MTLPASYNTGTVTGTYVNLDGTPAQGNITFTPRASRIVVSSDDVIVVPRKLTVTLDAGGSFTTNLPATDDPDISPTGFTYYVQENLTSGGGSSYDIEVPVGSTQDLSDVLAGTVGSGGSTIVRGEKGDPGIDGEVTTAALDAAIAAIPSDAAAATASLRTLGTGATQAAAGSSLAAKEDAGVAATLVATGTRFASLGLRPKLNTWFTKRAAGTRAKMLVVGDSTSGTRPTDGTTADIWVKVLTDLLAEQLKTPKPMGWRYAYGDAGAGTFDTVGGTQTNITTGGWGTSLAATQSTEVVGYMDRITIDYNKSVGGGTLEIRDGGSGGTLLGTINCSGTAKAGYHQSYDLTEGIHTIHIKATGATCLVGGANGSVGPVEIYSAAHGGLTTQNYIASPSYALNSIENNDFDIVLSALGTNDDLANYDSRTRTWYTSIQTAMASGDLIHCIPPISNSLAGAGFTAPEAELGRIIAEDYDVTCVDLASILGPYPIENTLGLSDDGLHPNTKGHSLWAAAVMAVVGGAPFEIIQRTISRIPSIGSSSSDAARGDVLTYPRGDILTLEDDFLLGLDQSGTNPLGILRWSRQGVGTPISQTGAAEAGHPGVIILGASAASGDTCCLTGPTFITDNTGAQWTWTFWVKVPASGTRLQVGLGAGAHNELVSGSVVEFNGTSTWDLVTKYLGSEVSRTNITAETPAIGDWITVTFTRFGTLVAYSINDVACGTFNAPASAVPMVGIKALTAGAKSVKFDRFQASLTGITRA